MEILANCNYMDSLLYIEMLFENYANQMSNCRTKSHVNFKSLLSFLNKDNGYMGTNIDDIVDSLIAKDVFDLEKVNVIMKHYGQEIANQGGTKHFEIKSVTLSEDAAKLLNTNYVHETFADFIPEGIIEIDVPEIHGNLDDLIDSADETAEITTDVEILDEDIETAFTRIERKDLKSKLIAIEEELSEEEEIPENESNNNQIEEKNGGDDFDWF
jgi:nitrous oxide reductase